MKKSIYAALIAAATVTAAHATIINASLEIGDFEGSTLQISGQNLEQAPFNFYYAGSGSQCIYSAAEIAPLFQHGATINAISFRYGDPTYSHFTEFTADLQVYLQLIDAAQFTYVDNKSNWFTPSATSGTATMEYNWTMDLMGGEDVITMTFAQPLVITSADAGKNLLVTSCADMRDGEEAQYWIPYVFNNAQRNYRMASFGFDGVNDFMSRVAAGGEISANPCHSDCYNTDLPVCRIDYSYDDTEDGVAEIAADSETEVFDLQGRRVSNSAEGLNAGIYLMRNGDKTVKMVVK